MLQADHITKTFGGVRALDDCSLRLEAGRITGLIGPNGAGKTTLFNILAGAYPADSGCVTFLDQQVTGLPAHLLFRKGLVRTFQIPQEFGRLTALENLLVVPADQTGEALRNLWVRARRIVREEVKITAEADATLDFLGLSRLRDTLAHKLSGGQKKLLELGRAMMANPRLLLLDEPGAGINPSLLRDLADRIERLNRERGYTICIIEHNIDLISRLCDHVVVLAEGRPLAEGSIETIREDQRVLEAYLGTGDSAQ